MTKPTATYPTLLGATQAAMSDLSDLLRASLALEDLPLSDHHRVELEVQLFDRLRQVGDGIGEMALVLCRRGAPSALGRTECGKSGIERWIDVHEGVSVSAGDPDVGASDVPATTVAEQGTVGEVLPPPSPTGVPDEGGAS